MGFKLFSVLCSFLYFLFSVNISCSVVSYHPHTAIKTITMSSTNNDINPFTNKAYSAKFFVLRKTAQTLPVSQRIPQLLSRIKQSNVVVVMGETGSGKT